MACAKNSHCLLFPITFPSLLWNHCQYPNVQISHFEGKVQIFRFAWQQQPCLWLLQPVWCVICQVCQCSVARRWDPPIGWRWRWHSTSAVARQQSSMEQVRGDSSGGGDGQKSSYRDHCGYLAVWRQHGTVLLHPTHHITEYCCCVGTGHRRPDCIPDSFHNSCFVFRIDKLELTRCIQKQT